METDKINLNTVKSKFLKTCKEVYPYFQQDNENDGTIKLLLFYMARDPRFESTFPDKNYNLNKGIWLHGNNGTGKTILMKAMQKANYYMQTEYQFRYNSMRDLCANYQDKGSDALRAERKHWFIDEFGLKMENDGNVEFREKINRYGTKIIVGDEVIGTRYDLFQQGFITHFTTNLTMHEVCEYYDKRTVSRLMEMCNFIPLDGTDRRMSAKPVRPVKTVYEERIDKRQAEIDWWQMIIRQHAAYKITGNMEMIGSFRQFTAFEDAGLISMTKDQKLQFMEQAREIILGKREGSAIVMANMKEYRKVKALKTAIEDNVLKPEQDNELKSVAVTLAMKHYYDSKTAPEFEALVNEVIGKL